MERSYLASGELLAWRGPGGGFAGVVDPVDIALQDLATYPRWLVALILGVLAVVIIWIGAKLLKWTIYLFAALLLITVLVGIFQWWVG